ncbi:DUF6041 domain-containing protein [Pseudoalteromonas ardens]|uniref:Fumarate reductase n=1 Tax=Pseudoalteromonas rubra TaxID=43658 RepID=A0A0L0EU07_9GAMM|nr:DUF6041 domain-containing protein [Pseudoalteromonas sp. R96]KNC67358.1 fumarate reductase [Pseudoalteromonas rubra]MDK1311611.1 DUF6041 domain-containing protein [Pseudoalteromonas sp. R96]
MLVQRIFAVLYMLAGLAKAFPQLENVPDILRQAAAANQGTWYAGLSNLLAQHGEITNVVVAVALFGSGLVLWLNPRWTRFVIYGQLAMMAVFITILHRSQPQVIPLDAIFIIAALAMLRQQFRRTGSKRVFASQDFAKPKAQAKSPDKPKLADEYDVIIIGAGVSGLTAASEFTTERVLVLEKSPTFGGNARCNSHRSLSHPIAGVCFQQPIPGSDMDQLLSKLGLQNKFKTNAEDTLVFFDTILLLKCLNEITLGFIKFPSYLLKPSVWGLTGQLLLNALIGKPYVVAAKQLGDPIFADLYQFLDGFAATTERFPQVPWHEQSGWKKEEMVQLDNLSLYSYLFEPEKTASFPTHLQPPRKLGKLVENAVTTTLRVECLDIHEVSAYVGLHFLVGYLRGNLVTLPGGNGHISEALVAHLSKQTNITLLSDVVLNNLDNTEASVQLTAKVQHHNISVKAKKLIWAAPKHHVTDWLPTLPETQLKAIKAIRHEDYYLANALLSRPVLSHSFGGYLIEPERQEQPYAWCKTGTCLVANWMDSDNHSEGGVLTLLKPTTREQRQGRTAENDFTGLQQQTYREVSLMLNNIGVDPRIVEDIQIWYWPDALITSVIGQQASGLFQSASQPHFSVHFANQDSVGIGNLESAIFAGKQAATQIKRALQHTETTAISRNKETVS